MTIWPENWGQVLLPHTPVAEMIVRISVVYLFLFALLRVVLKRESAATGISDLLVLVLIADAVQNGMAGTYTSVGDALVLATVLVFWDWALSALAYRYRWLRRLIRPRPLLIIQDGKLLRHNARRELLTREEIEGELRLQSINSISEVAEAYIESNGEISAIKKDGEQGGRKKRRASTA
jgi:uncharacterized membrane protein YcaP (DUF421 family)